MQTYVKRLVLHGLSYASVVRYSEISTKIFLLNSCFLGLLYGPEDKNNMFP
jgi:hypothetical protein